jgi:hypothetical protein
MPRDKGEKKCKARRYRRQQFSMDDIENKGARMSERDANPWISSKILKDRSGCNLKSACSAFSALSA